ncbi:MAG: hypothetical protein KZQ83_18045 [gamma proteobacterium symbiont of Taylorina sp.]|nr:hypothetical protein [gamma proteobacterium symbiont of Taylorina sp.]
MKIIIKFIIGCSLLIASAISLGDDNYRYGNNYINNNDWSNTPWAQNNSYRDRNSMPWGGNSMPWGNDNPLWDRGNSAWRDWDTNKWGGNGMPWGGGGMPFMKDRKYNKNRGNYPYGRPYSGGYGNPYQRGYDNYYNSGQSYPSPSMPVSPPEQETFINN